MFGDEEFTNLEELAVELLDKMSLEDILVFSDLSEVDLVVYLILEGIIDAEELRQA